MSTKQSIKALFTAAFCALPLLAGTGLFTTAAVAQTGDAAAGKKATAFACRNCHDVSGNEKAQNPPGGAPSFFEVAQNPKTTGPSLHKFLTLPHGKMDNVVLSGREIDDLTAYILSLRRK
jgi:mono/diheme cytochrome c family protein